LPNLLGDSVDIRGQFLVKQAERLVTIALADVERHGFALHQIVQSEFSIVSNRRTGVVVGLVRLTPE
jgi:hypothetical protein